MGLGHVCKCFIVVVACLMIICLSFMGLLREHLHTVSEVEPCSFLSGGWFHPLNHVIGPLRHSQRFNGWSPVPVTNIRALPGAGYKGN